MGQPAETFSRHSLKMEFAPGKRMRSFLAGYVDWYFLEIEASGARCTAIDNNSKNEDKQE